MRPVLATQDRRALYILPLTRRADLEFGPSHPPLKRHASIPQAHALGLACAAHPCCPLGHQLVACIRCPSPRHPIPPAAHTVGCLLHTPGLPVLHLQQAAAAICVHPSAPFTMLAVGNCRQTPAAALLCPPTRCVPVPAPPLQGDAGGEPQIL